MRSLMVVSLLVPGLAFADSAEPPKPEPNPPGGDVVMTGKYSGVGVSPPGHWRFMLSDLSIFRLNPLGIETRARVGLQKRLYPSDKPIAQNNFLFLGAYPKLNPASAQIAFGGEIQPLSIFNLRANVEVGKYFGTFGFLQSFSSPHANYSDHRLQELENIPGFEPQSASFFHAALHPMVQLKLANKIAIRSLFQIDYWNFALRDGDTVAYEATYDTLLPDKAITLSTDTDVLFVGKPGLAVGVRHTWVKPLYKQKHFADVSLTPDENADEFDRFSDANSHQRVGLFAAYTLHDRGPSRWNKPTILLIASWYLDHNYRTGTPDVMQPDERPDDFTSRAFPYLLLGFAFESDLMSR